MNKERFVLVNAEQADGLHEQERIHPVENGQYFIRQEVFDVLQPRDFNTTPPLYLTVSFPESQLFMDRHLNEIYLINDEAGINLYGNAAYFVEENLYRNTLAAFKKELQETKDRILAFVSKNIPSRKIEFEKYPAEKYPIKLNLSFSRRDLGIAQKIKAVLNSLPKDKVRYRKTTNKYVRGANLHCYFKDVDCLTPVAENLKGENLWRSTLNADDEQLSPEDLIEQARGFI